MARILVFLILYHFSDAIEPRCSPVGKELFGREEGRSDGIIRYVFQTDDSVPTSMHLNSLEAYTAAFEFPAMCNIKVTEVNFGPEEGCEYSVHRKLLLANKQWAKSTALPDAERSQRAITFSFSTMDRFQVLFLVQAMHGSSGCRYPVNSTTDEPFVYLMTEDVDECAENKQICSPQLAPQAGRCVNVFGSYECICAEGYVRKDDICQDINECTGEQDPCHPYQHANGGRCVNINGSFACLCNPAYTGMNCTDRIDTGTQGSDGSSAPAFHWAYVTIPSAVIIICSAVVILFVWARRAKQCHVKGRDSNRTATSLAPIASGLPSATGPTAKSASPRRELPVPMTTNDCYGSEVVPVPSPRAQTMPIKTQHRPECVQSEGIRLTNTLPERTFEPSRTTGALGTNVRRQYAEHHVYAEIFP